MNNFKELKVWRKSYELCLRVYKVTCRFPDSEKFGLSSQLRRSAISIPSNIAEGFGRKSTNEYVYFLHISYSCLCELETQILISKDLNYISLNQFIYLNKILMEIGKMLRTLIKVLKSRN